ncbi:CoA-transferase [Pseudarthrobacter sp. NIBRBAC000502771]|uniref:CoA-transferase n=1 Tax=Pseudarthrobacter sp. NIBRBAC000502771 TaxID=2590774 RepID=UPI00352BD8FB
MGTLLAGLPVSILCTVNRVCGPSLDAAIIPSRQARGHDPASHNLSAAAWDEGFYDNLVAPVPGTDLVPGEGIGQPTLVSNYLTEEQNITLHTENGMLGMGLEAKGGEIDEDLINAGKIPVTELPGASYFHHADSFVIMRGGHRDICVLGAFQVSATGDLANWHTGAPGAIPAVGGAMDLATGAKDVFVMMTLLTREGASKIVDACTYPVTGVGCVTRVYTDKGVFLTGPDGVSVRETFGCTLEELQGLVPVPLKAAV